MTWASHPTAEMPVRAKAWTGRHRRRSAGVIGSIATLALLVLTVAAAMLSPTLVGWPPPSQPAPAAPSTVAEHPGVPIAPGSSAPPEGVRQSTQPTSTRTPTPARSGPASTGLAAMEDAVLIMTNAERQQRGCVRLVLDMRLRTAARLHSADMAHNRYFSHDSPDGKDPGRRMRDAGYNTDGGWAENIARGYPTAAAVMTGWMRSPGHRDNILNCSMHSIGVGVSRDSDGQLYWTQDFGGR